MWLVHYEYSPTGLEEDYESFNDDDGDGFAVYYGATWDIKDGIINESPSAPTYTRPAESTVRTERTPDARGL